MNKIFTASTLVENLHHSFPEFNNDLHPIWEQLEKIIVASVANREYDDEVSIIVRRARLELYSYRLEDFMESSALESAQRRCGFNKMISRRSSLQKDIRDFQRELENSLIRRGHATEVEPIEGEISYRARDEQDIRVSRKTNHEETENVTRMKKDEERLMDALMSGSAPLSFICIYGMGGTGKTTLAKRIFNSPHVMFQFHVHAWVYVSQDYRRRDILLGILAQIRALTSDTMNLSDEDLAERTYRCLKGLRYLIVLDDMWSREVWLSLRIAFPSDDNGSRILLTTWTRDVASWVGEPNTITLADVKGWESLKRKAGLDEREIDPETERICREIVMRSGGEPLVGIMLINMLKRMTAGECKVLLRDLVNGSPSQEIVAVDVLKLSYYVLPLYLRPCLLYFGHFPKDSGIETDTLYQLWIAEGLISMEYRGDGETMMDVAARNFDGLAEGSWVQMQEEENLSQGRFKSCHLHDSIRDFCISKVKHYDGLKDSLEGNEIMISSFRCAINLDKYERAEIPLYGKEDYLRSLLFFSSCQSKQGFIRPREIPYLERFISLRVLFLCGVDFKEGKFPKGVEKLIYLRYLSFRECYLVELSSSVSNMLYLQTLDLRVRNECEMIIPNVFGNLKRLRYLYLPLAYRSPNHNEKLNLGKLTDLEILENFDTSVCDAEDIFELINLTDLSASIEGNYPALQRILDHIDNQSKLRWISLDIRNFDCYTKERICVKENLFKCSAVHALAVEGHLGKLPEFNKISSKLTKIVLNGSELEEDPMQILQKLAHLKILFLETEAFVGKNPDKKQEKIPKKMKCSSSGFPELRYLKLSKLYNLEEWEVEMDAMKNLSTLAIQNCWKLQMLPEGLKFINGLRNLEITSMRPEFVSRIRKSDGTEGEDTNKIRHVMPNVKIDGQPLILKEPQLAGPREDPQSSSMH